MKHLVIAILHFYRWLISPLMPPSCKYTPTCSRYAIQAIELHGLRRGVIITFRRMMKCQPFSKDATTQGTYDPVPEKNTTMKKNCDQHKNDV